MNLISLLFVVLWLLFLKRGTLLIAHPVQLTIIIGNGIYWIKVKSIVLTIMYVRTGSILGLCTEHKPNL